MAWASNFPVTHPGSDRTGRAPAAPNIWRSGATEVIIVPALYDAPDGQQVRLAAFASNGALLFDQFVTRWDYGGLTAGDDCWYCPDFTKRPDPPVLQAMAALGPLRPAVAMFARSGDPEVVVADNYQNVVGFAFFPATGFRETFRKHLTNDSRGILMSAPVVLRDGHSVLSAWTESEKQTWLLFAGPHPVDWSEIVLPDLTKASPTLTTDGRILTLAHSGVTATQTYPRAEIALTMPTDLSGRLAPAAASRTYVYISTGAFLVTLDARTLQIVASYDWEEGGISSPAIGADGRVYAIAGETLFAFPPPPRCPRRVCPGDITAGGGPVFHSQQGTSAQAAKTSALSSGGSAQLSTAPK
jgi:hypothetical protein